MPKAVKIDYFENIMGNPRDISLTRPGKQRLMLFSSGAPSPIIGAYTSVGFLEADPALVLALMAVIQLSHPLLTHSISSFSFFSFRLPSCARVSKSDCTAPVPRLSAGVTDVRRLRALQVEV